jgi:hypothetical protein
MECEVFVDGVWCASVPVEIGQTIKAGDFITVLDKRRCSPNSPPENLPLRVKGVGYNLQFNPSLLMLSCRPLDPATKKTEPVLSQEQSAAIERMTSAQAAFERKVAEAADKSELASVAAGILDRAYGTTPRFVDHHGREVCGNDDGGLILCSRVKNHTGNHAIMKTANDMGSVSCDKTRDGNRCVLLPNHNGSCVFRARVVELEQMASDTHEGECG